MHPSGMHMQDYRSDVTPSYQGGGVGFWRQMHMTPPTLRQALIEDRVEKLGGRPMTEDLQGRDRRQVRIDLQRVPLNGRRRRRTEQMVNRRFASGSTISRRLSLVKGLPASFNARKKLIDPTPAIRVELQPDLVGCVQEDSGKELAFSPHQHAPSQAVRRLARLIQIVCST